MWFLLVFCCLSRNRHKEHIIPDTIIVPDLIFVKIQLKEDLLMLYKKNV